MMPFADDARTKVWCDRCDGDGTVPVDTLLAEELTNLDRVPRGPSLVPCPDCHGDGTIDVADLL